MGKRSGFGSFFYNADDELSGDWYQGDYLNDQRSGRGTYYWLNGDVYSGDWFENQRTGFGSFYYNNGDRYEGGFYNGSKNGYGTYFHADSKHSLTGRWVMDKLVKIISKQ
jgi:hypothetical protein